MPWTMLPIGTLQLLTDRSLASMLPGDTPLPQFVMSGDGHRHPPFAWTTVCSAVKQHVMNLIVNERLCVHVEQHPEDVTVDSVEPFLAHLFQQRRIFGWELAIYRPLQSVMEQCMTLMSGTLFAGDSKVVNEVVALDRDILRTHDLLWQIGNPPTLRSAMQQSLEFRQYFQEASKKPAMRNVATEDRFRRFLQGYINAAMQLRTDANPFIGANIQCIIERYPTSTHLITCGNAHIITNPLYRYIAIPPNASGVIDASQM